MIPELDARRGQPATVRNAPVAKLCQRTCQRRRHPRQPRSRVKIAPRVFRDAATSTVWNVTYFEWRTIVAPVLISFTSSVVTVQSHAHAGEPTGAGRSAATALERCVSAGLPRRFAWRQHMLLSKATRNEMNQYDVDTDQGGAVPCFATDTRPTQLRADLALGPTKLASRVGLSHLILRPGS